MSTSPDNPTGVKLIRSFEGHPEQITSIALDPAGGMLASGSTDGTLKLWDVESGSLIRSIDGSRHIYSIAFHPREPILAGGRIDGRILSWQIPSGELLNFFGGNDVDYSRVMCLAFDPQGLKLASAHYPGGVYTWDLQTTKLIHRFHAFDPAYSVAFHPQGDKVVIEGHTSRTYFLDIEFGQILAIFDNNPHGSITSSFDPQGELLACGCLGGTINIFDTTSGTPRRRLEGHTGTVTAVAFSPDGRLLASKSLDHTIRLWNCETWETVAVIPNLTNQNVFIRSLAFHPQRPWLVAAAPQANTSIAPWDLHLWELDYEQLLGKHRTETSEAVHHTTAKIVLLGDHSVGKSALGHRLIHGEFKPQSSTHGHQLWVFPEMGERRPDGTECEAILWDFAGQPDYRLVHALFVDNADLALVLFDASDLHDPLHGVGFWLKQLQTADRRCPILLVAAQADRGSPSLTEEELQTFCRNHGIEGPITTSAATGLGIDKLVDRMKQLIPWQDKPAVVTTVNFKRIKDYVLDLKETPSEQRLIVAPEELRARLEATDNDWKFTDAEMLTAVAHLENYGYVRRLRTSKGEFRILLQPEVLNNLASSFVLEARRNQKGLGALEEKRLLQGDYDFPELKNVNTSDRDVLLDSAAMLFLEHNVCFRETDPLRIEPYLVFPELINLKTPREESTPVEDGASYTVSGPTENVFASLVVLLGYTHTFTRTAQWQNNARYEVGDGLVCGFRQQTERDGELDFVLCFGKNVGASVRTLFQGLFESFLARRNLTVMRLEPIRCGECKQLLDRSVVRQRLKEERTFAFCNNCGERLALPVGAEPIHLTREEQVEVQSQRLAAEQRTRFEQAIFTVRTYIAEKKIEPPECFISYAWGVPEHERWVQNRLATDLQKAGIQVILDRWHNAQIGANIMRFVSRIEESDRIVVVGTPLYRNKANNVFSDRGSVVAAEYDLAGIRLLATEDNKRSILPVLLAGEESESFPALLRGRVYGDFRDDQKYFITAFDLILSIYEIAPNDPAVADLRASLTDEGFLIAD